MPYPPVGGRRLEGDSIRTGTGNGAGDKKKRNKHGRCARRLGRQAGRACAASSEGAFAPPLHTRLPSPHTYAPHEVSRALQRRPKDPATRAGASGSTGPAGVGPARSGGARPVPSARRGFPLLAGSASQATPLLRKRTSVQKQQAASICCLLV